MGARYEPHQIPSGYWKIVAIQQDDGLDVAAFNHGPSNGLSFDRLASGCSLRNFERAAKTRVRPGRQTERRRVTDRYSPFNGRRLDIPMPAADGLGLVTARPVGAIHPCEHGHVGRVAGSCIVLIVVISCVRATPLALEDCL